MDHFVQTDRDLGSNEDDDGLHTDTSPKFTAWDIKYDELHAHHLKRPSHLGHVQYQTKLHHG